MCIPSVDVTYTDFAGALDYINHESLVSVLEAVGFYNIEYVPVY